MMVLTRIFLFFAVKSALLSAVAGDQNKQLAGNGYCLLRRKDYTNDDRT